MGRCKLDADLGFLFEKPSMTIYGSLHGFALGPIFDWLAVYHGSVVKGLLG